MGLLSFIAAPFTGGASVWAPYAIAAGVGAVAASLVVWKVMDWRLEAASTRADSAERALFTMTEDRDRNVLAYTSCHAATLVQNDAIESMRADTARLNQLFGEAAEKSRAEKQAAQTQIDKWKELARDHPDQVNPLGSIARDGYKLLLHPKRAPVAPSSGNN